MDGSRFFILDAAIVLGPGARNKIPGIKHIRATLRIFYAAGSQLRLRETPRRSFLAAYDYYCLAHPTPSHTPP